MFSDASWKNSKILGNKGTVATEIGVFCQFEVGDISSNIFIQASTATARHFSRLKLRLFSWHCQLKSLVSFICSKSPSSLITLPSPRQQHPGMSKQPKSIGKFNRCQQDYLQVSMNLRPRVYHVSRDFNGVEDNCAHQVLV